MKLKVSTTRHVFLTPNSGRPMTHLGNLASDVELADAVRECGRINHEILHPLHAQHGAHARRVAAVIEELTRIGFLDRAGTK